MQGEGDKKLSTVDRLYMGHTPSKARASSNSQAGHYDKGPGLSPGTKKFLGSRELYILELQSKLHDRTKLRVNSQMKTFRHSVNSKDESAQSRTFEASSTKNDRKRMQR